MFSYYVNWLFRIKINIYRDIQPFYLNKEKEKIIGVIKQYV
jgi:hypothetical protein